MTEILHRNESEFAQKEKRELKLIIVEGLAKAATGNLVFSGFTTEAIQSGRYVNPYKRMFAVNDSEWEYALRVDDELDDPLYYAELSADLQGGFPAVGAYDDALLTESTREPCVYKPLPGSSIAAACLRVVAWDR